MDRHVVRPISPDTLDDMRKLLQQPPEGWCWCVAWEVPTWEGWTERSAEQNCALRERLWAHGEYHGYVFYLDNSPVGWCRVGPTRAWPKFCAHRNVEASDDVYAFTCFGMRPHVRGEGHLHVFFKQVLADLSRRGVKRVIAVPKKFQDRQADGRVWNGPASLFLKAGFVPMRDEPDWQLVGCDLPMALEGR